MKILAAIWWSGVAMVVLDGYSPAVAQRAAAAVPNLAGKVLTVNGPVDPAVLGQTLMHEHIFIEFKAPASAVPQAGGSGAQLPGRGQLPPGWNRLDNYDESLAEVMEFKKAGGGTIVDTSSIGLTRRPEWLRKISAETGLHVVMGAGWYQKGLYAADMSQRSVEELTDAVVRDVTVGAEGTTIRSGIIGEVGVQGRPLVENELKSVRASARAARLTGAPMTIHSFGSPEEMLQVLDVIAAEGVDLSRVVMSHTGGRDMEYVKRLLARGVYVEFDYMGQAPLTPERDAALIQSIAELIKAGYARQVVIAHDICTQPQLKKNGGGGFTYIANTILPGLRRSAVSETDLRTIMVDNPRRVLTFVAPQPLVRP